MEKQKTKWQLIWSRQYTPFIAKTYFVIYQNDNPMWIKCPNKLYLPEGGLNSYYVEVGELKKICEKFEKYVLSHSLSLFVKRYEETFKKWLAWGIKLNKKDFSKLSNDQFAKLLIEVSVEFTRSCEWQFLSFVALEGFVKKAEDFLKSDPDLSLYFDSLSVPHREPKITRARMELLNIIVKGDRIEEKFEKYCRKYAWLNMYEFIDPALSKENLMGHSPKREDAEKELNNYYNARKENLKAFKELVSKVKDKTKKNLLLAANRFSYLKEMRDDYRRPVYLAFQPFWNEVAKRTGLTFKDANYLVEDELFLAIKNPSEKYRDLARERANGYALELLDGKFSIYSDKKKIGELLSMVEEKFEQQEISGSPAFLGKATGRVKIIYRKEEFTKFNDGDILVTPMTHPEFLPMMRKAVAFVTDEGGITCHAAIVAREMKRPCIIGTKNATKVLKDGDMVEVDAEKGIVKILKKK